MQKLECMVKSRLCSIMKCCLGNLHLYYFLTIDFNRDSGHSKGCLVTQLVERGTPGEEVLGLIPAVAARCLLVG